MYDRILVPTDGSDVASAAVDAAIVLAERFDADLHLLHVREVGEPPADREDEVTSELEQLGRDAADRAAERAREAGLTATTAVVEGGQTPHRAILDYADDHDVDLLALGTHGRTGLDRWVLGSVAEQTVRESPIPVLTVHADTVLDDDIESILVPTDGSEGAEAAADHAIALAAATGAALHVVHAVDVGMITDGTAVGTALDALEEAGQTAVDRVVDRAEAADISTIQASVLTGRAYRAITDYADEADVDYVVMGTHGRTGMERVLLGSVTERVVRLSDVPVIAVGGPSADD
jgi:nucleotide-binding universal stress UspA family protein